MRARAMRAHLTIVVLCAQGPGSAGTGRGRACARLDHGQVPRAITAAVRLMDVGRGARTGPAPAGAGRGRGWIMDRCPWQLKLPYGLWTSGVMRELIRRKLGKERGLSTV